MALRTKKRKRRSDAADDANFIHIRASTQLTDALDAEALRQQCSRSELVRGILETVLNPDDQAAAGARAGLFLFRGCMHRALARTTEKISALLQDEMSVEIAELQKDPAKAASFSRQSRVRARPAPLTPYDDDDDDDAGLLPEGMSPQLPRG